MQSDPSSPLHHHRFISTANERASSLHAPLPRFWF